MGGEDLCCLVDGEVEVLSKVFPFVENEEADGIEAEAVALFASDADGGEEVHLDFAIAHAPAVGAHPSSVVVGEVAWGEASHLRFGEGGEEVAEAWEEVGIGTDIGAGGEADWVL